MSNTAVTICRNIRKHCYVTADITLTGFYLPLGNICPYCVCRNNSLLLSYGSCYGKIRAPSADTGARVWTPEPERTTATTQPTQPTQPERQYDNEKGSRAMTTHNTMNGTNKSTTKNTGKLQRKANGSAGSHAIPDAICTVERVMNYDGPVYLLHVAKCPLCGGHHQHGGGSDPDHLLLGHRGSHCDKPAYGSNGYNLVLSTEAK